MNEGMLAYTLRECEMPPEHRTLVTAADAELNSLLVAYREELPALHAWVDENLPRLHTPIGWAIRWRLIDAMNNGHTMDAVFRDLDALVAREVVAATVAVTLELSGSVSLVTLPEEPNVTTMSWVWVRSKTGRVIHRARAWEPLTLCGVDIGLRMEARTSAWTDAPDCRRCLRVTQTGTEEN